MMKTNCPCGGLLDPTVAGRHVRLNGSVLKDWLCPACFYLLLFMYFFCSAGWRSVLPDLSRVFPGMAQTVWQTGHFCLFGSLSSGRAGPALSRHCASACPRNISVPLTPVCFDFDAINVNLQTQAPPPPTLLDSPSVVSVTAAPSRSFKATSFGLGVNKVMTFSHAASHTSLCLLNLRASIDFHWERKTSQRET